VIIARGRRYFSNDELVTALSSNSAPEFQMFLGTVPSVNVYHLNDSSLEIIKTAAQIRAAAKAHKITKS